MDSTVTTTAPVEQPPRPPQLIYQFKFQDNGLSLAMVFLKNILFSILTIGIYYPWAKTNIRHSLWRSSSFVDERFIYTGTGKELFFGYLKVLAVYGLFSILGNVSIIFGFVFFLLLMVLVPYAIVASKRYLLSRTMWRGIRFNMKSIYKEFFSVSVTGGLLSILTLGLYIPIYTNQLYSLMLNNTHIGTLSVKYTGRGSDVFVGFFKYFILTCLFMIFFIGVVVAAGMFFATDLVPAGLSLSKPQDFITLLTSSFFSFILVGILASYIILVFAWARYQSWLWNYRTAHTFIGNANLGFAKGISRFTGLGVFLLYFVNALIVICTLGLGLPWAMARIGRYMLANIAFVGNINFDRIEQTQQVKSNSIGDAVADVLDVGLSI